MSAPGIDPRVLDALQSASSLELFQLSTLIERLLADPRRIIAVRKDMHLGQTVRFVDWRDGSLREGKVVAMREAAARYINELQDFMGEHSRMLMSLIVAQSYSQTAAESLTDIEGLKAYFEQGRATMESRIKEQAKVRPELMVRVSFAAVLASVMFKDWLFPPGMADDEEIRRAIADFTIDGIGANIQDGF